MRSVVVVALASTVVAFACLFAAPRCHALEPPFDYWSGDYYARQYVATGVELAKAAFENGERGKALKIIRHLTEVCPGAGTQATIASGLHGAGETELAKQYALRAIAGLGRGPDTGSAVQSVLEVVQADSQAYLPSVRGALKANPKSAAVTAVSALAAQAAAASGIGDVDALLTEYQQQFGTALRLAVQDTESGPQLVYMLLQSAFAADLLAAHPGGAEPLAAAMQELEPQLCAMVPAATVVEAYASVGLVDRSVALLAEVTQEEDPSGEALQAVLSRYGAMPDEGKREVDAYLASLVAPDASAEQAGYLAAGLMEPPALSPAQATRLAEAARAGWIEAKEPANWALAAIACYLLAGKPAEAVREVDVLVEHVGEGPAGLSGQWMAQLAGDPKIALAELRAALLLKATRREEAKAVLVSVLPEALATSTGYGYGRAGNEAALLRMLGDVDEQYAVVAKAVAGMNEYALGALRSSLASQMAWMPDPTFARVVLGAVVARMPEELALRKQYADLLLEADEPEAALPHLEAVSQGDPDDVSARLVCARALIALGRTDEARSHLGRAVLGVEDDLESTEFQEAIEWEALLGEVDAAAKRVESALEGRRDDVAALASAATLYASLGLLDRARTLCVSAIEKASSAPGAAESPWGMDETSIGALRMDLAILLLAQGETRQGAEMLVRALGETSSPWAASMGESAIGVLDDPQARLAVLQGVQKLRGAGAGSGAMSVELAEALADVGRGKEALRKLPSLEAMLRSTEWIGQGGLGVLAKVAAAAGQMDRAVEAARAALVQDPTNDTAGEALVAVAAAGKREAAEAALTETMEVSPFEARPRFWLGRLKEEQGDGAGAIAEYRKCLALDPYGGTTGTGGGVDRSAHWRLAELLEKQGGAEEEAAALRATVRAAELVSRAELCAWVGGPGSSRALLLQAVEIAPDQHWVHASLGGALLEMGLTVQGLDEMRRAFELMPRGLGPLIPSDRFNWSLMNRDAVKRLALETFSRYTEQHPDDARGFYLKGMSLELYDRTEEATGAYERAVELDPAFVSAWHRLDLGYDALGKTEQLVAARRRITELMPRSGDAWDELAAALRQAGRYADAAAALVKSREVSPAVSLPAGCGYAPWVGASGGG